MWRTKGMRKAYATAAVAISVLLLAPPALACGESLFRVGKGLTFREYTAPLPGHILIVARTENERAMAEAIQRAGHHVHVVADATEISAAMSEHAADIVLSYADQGAIVAQQLRNFDATYIPVTRNGQSYLSADRIGLSADDTVKTFLKAIHRVLRERKPSFGR